MALAVANRRLVSLRLESLRLESLRLEGGRLVPQNATPVNITVVLAPLPQVIFYSTGAAEWMAVTILKTMVDGLPFDITSRSVRIGFYRGIRAQPDEWHAAAWWTLPSGLKQARLQLGGVGLNLPVGPYLVALQIGPPNAVYPETIEVLAGAIRVL